MLMYLHWIEGVDFILEVVDQAHKEYITEKANLLKALAHPVRLCLLNQLVNNGASNVTDIVSCLDVSQSNVSQHLGKLRDLGLVEARKEANQVYYTCEKEEVIEIVKLMMRGAE